MSSLSGLVTARLAAKQFKSRSTSSTPPQLYDQVNTANQPVPIPSLIPSSLIDPFTSTLASIQQSIETQKPQIELLVYWETLTSSLNITFSIFAAWLFTKLGFSFIWILLIIYYSNSTFKRNQQRLKLKIKRDQKLKSAQKLMETDVESCEWLNTMLARYWQQYEPSLSETISLQINTALEINKPSFLDDLRLSHFTLGSEAPRVDSIKTYTLSADDVLSMDLSLVFEPFDSDVSKKNASKRNSRIELVARIGKGVASIPILILLTEVSFRGLMRVKIKFTTVFPHVDIIELAFTSRPVVDFILRPLKGLDLMDLPGLSSFLTDTINWALDTNIVDPATIKLPILDMMNPNGAARDQIVGVLVVSVFEAKDLKNFELSGISDPYLKICIGGKTVARTKTIESNLSPFWGEQKFVLIYKSQLEQHSHLTDELHYEIFDFNKIGKDKLMATSASLSLSKYVSLFHLSIDQNDTQVSDTERNKIIQEWGDPNLDKVVWNPVYTSRERQHGQVRSSLSYSPIPLIPLIDSNAGILQVTIHQANDLQFSKNSCTYIQIELNNVVEGRTTTKRRTNTPVWDHVYSVYITDLESARLKLTLKEDVEAGIGGIIGVSTINSVVGSLVGSTNILGWISINIKQALTSTDWFTLSGQKQGKLRVSLKYTGIQLESSSTYEKEPIGIVKITIKSGKGLMNVEMLRKSDPYAVLHVEGKKIGRTHHIENTLDPVWDDIVYAVVYSKSARLLVDVYDYNMLQSDKRLGSTELYLDELLYNDDDADNAAERESTLALYEKDGLVINCRNTSADVTAPLYTGLESIEKVVNRNRKQKGHINFSVDLFPILRESLIKAERIVVPKSLDDGVAKDLALTRHVGISETLNLYSSGIIKFKVHEVKGLPRSMCVYVQFNMDDEVEPALQTSILDKQSDLVWDESCDVFIKDVQSKFFTMSVRESLDGISRNDKPIAELCKISPINYIGKASVWIALAGSVEIRVSCAYLPIDIVMEDSEKADNTGVLRLSILNGTNLEGVDTSGTSDPYCVVLVNNEIYARTRTIKQTINPVFNESFFIPITIRQRTSVIIQIYDHNTILKDVLLGNVTIALSKICAGELLVDSFQIEGAPRGALNVQLLFEAMTGDEVKRSIHLGKHGNRSVTCTGSVVSLSNENVSSEAVDIQCRSIFSAEDLSKPVVTGSIYVTIEAARSLKPVDENGLSDPYVKVIQNYRGKIKTIFRTDIVKKTLNPVFTKGTSTFNVKIPPSVFRFGVKDHNAFQESKSLGEATWDVVAYLMAKDQLADGAYPFDLWLPIELGGTGELHITGSIIIGTEVVQIHPRSSSIASSRTNSIFKRPLSFFAEKKQ